MIPPGIHWAFQLNAEEQTLRAEGLELEAIRARLPDPTHPSSRFHVLRKMSSLYWRLMEDGFTATTYSDCSPNRLTTVVIPA